MIVWHGSINLLSFGSAMESVMGLDSPNIANKLMKTVYILGGYRRFLRIHRRINTSCWNYIHSS